MDTNRIIADIDTEISKLQQARAILASVGVKNGPGRPNSGERKVLKPKKRKMSAKGRAAISAAMKARWSKKKEGTRANVKKTAAS